MDDEIAKTLRAEFPAEHIGKLPRITCRACSNATSRECDNHKKSECSVCGNWITNAHMHIDYVGHGAVTDRLLEADPEWTWDPVGEDPVDHQPVLVYAPNKDGEQVPVGFWITLTVGGVTRRGYGSCPTNQDDAVKVLIGDALRNAAMRFGVAVDLWIKGHAEDDERATDSGEPRGGGRAAPRGRQASPETVSGDTLIDADARWDLQVRIAALPVGFRTDLKAKWVEAKLVPARSMTVGQVVKATTLIESFEAAARNAEVDLDTQRELALAEVAEGLTETLAQPGLWTGNGGGSDRTHGPETAAQGGAQASVPADAPAANEGAIELPEVEPLAEPWDLSAGAAFANGGWGAVATVVSAEMRDVGAALDEGVKKSLAGTVWKLHHSTLDKKLTAANVTGFEGAPIDVRRMALTRLVYRTYRERLGPNETLADRGEPAL